MAERQRGNLPAARTKVRIVADAQNAGLLLHGSDNSTFDLAFVPGVNNDHFQPKAAHRGLRLLDVILHETRVVRIHEQRDSGGVRKTLTQQLQPLADKLDSEECDSRNIPSRT